MSAIMWISGRVCRCIVKDEAGKVIDMCDDWNNRASCESFIYENYPSVRIKFYTDNKEKMKLDEEWNRCKNGS